MYNCCLYPPSVSEKRSNFCYDNPERMHNTGMVLVKIATVAATLFGSLMAVAISTNLIANFTNITYGVIFGSCGIVVLLGLTTILISKLSSINHIARSNNLKQVESLQVSSSPVSHSTVKNSAEGSGKIQVPSDAQTISIIPPILPMAEKSNFANIDGNIQLSSDAQDIPTIPSIPTMAKESMEIERDEKLYHSICEKGTVEGNLDSADLVLLGDHHNIVSEIHLRNDVYNYIKNRKKQPKQIVVLEEGIDTRSLPGKCLDTMSACIRHYLLHAGSISAIAIEDLQSDRVKLGGWDNNIAKQSVFFQIHRRQFLVQQLDQLDLSLPTSALQFLSIKEEATRLKEQEDTAHRFRELSLLDQVGEFRKEDVCVFVIAGVEHVKNVYLRFQNAAMVIPKENLTCDCHHNLTPEEYGDLVKREASDVSAMAQ